MLKVLTAILLLTSGLVAYWFFRPNIYFFEQLGLSNQESKSLITYSALSVFMSNYFADIVWCVAAFQIAFWLKQRNHPPFYYYSLLILPFASEGLQGLGIVRGTFDWIDILIYLSLLLFCFNNKTSYMRNKTKHLAGISVLIVFILAMLASTGPKKVVYTYTPGTIKLDATKDDIFTKPSLTKILQTTSNLSIVLRVPGQITKVLEENKFASNSIYNTVEKEIARAGFTVRDRGLFQQVLENTTVDYSKIKELTGTDLILELVGYEKVKYPISKYRDNAGNEKSIRMGFAISGVKAEFKIISVNENDFVGSYVFYSTPCTNGCNYRFDQFGDASGVTDFFSTTMAVEDFFRDCSLRLIKELRPK